ncbi:comF family protein [Caminicella sporogenes DSM 14501]|uniref:ComF family protein n=1 Tax=Caminicella sporogenes DSM 14501 TaxID=1121266 RepID=A0A1M6Q1B7_9FIRM|nr:ComF family protein [Caminicella sporogenes]RKD23537.1 hypothetical protein BET04_03830 [Caminicella sporogenes]SHK13917.1 comF family protein [Caminicella sporogenes DSM 14501]
MRKNIIFEYIDIFLNFIFPRNIYCILCNRPIDRDRKYSLCDRCFKNIRFIRGKTCTKCGKPLNEFYMYDNCPECMNNEFYFTKAVSCVEYDDISKKIIYELKYNKKRYISYHMAEIMADKFKESFSQNIDVIMPVPLHKSRERERTFNQAYLISKYLARMIDKSVDNKSLVRVKNTKIQNKLTKEERKSNLEKAFKVVNALNVDGKIILLVDDIFTTGLTADRCSRVLIESGALKVYVLTFATGRNT